jgi:hypothetical protein
MTASTVADHLADRLAELSGDNVFGASVDHRLTGSTGNSCPPA